MRIKVTKNITTLDGKAVKVGEGEEQDNLTLRQVVINAMLSHMEGDEKLPGTKKFELGQIAQRVHDYDECDLRAEELTTIKERVAKIYSTLVIMRAYELLDPVEPTEAAPKKA